MEEIRRDRNLALVGGKLPPQAIDTEEAALGAIMIHQGAKEALMDGIRPEYFYDPRHQAVFAAMRDLYNNKKAIDLVTVPEQLKTNGQLDEIGGAFFVSDLTRKVASSANYDDHVEILKEKWAKRKMIRIAALAIKEAYDETTFSLDILGSFSKESDEVISERLGTTSEHVSDIVKDAVSIIDKMRNGKITPGRQTYFKHLDKKTGGFFPGESIVIAARPGMGKTAFVLSFTRKQCKAGKRVMFFSIEMIKRALMNRLIANEAEINSEQIKKAQEMSSSIWEKVAKAGEEIATWDLIIDDTSALHFRDMRAIARKHHKEKPLDFIIIDYLQLMKGDATNREQEISEISQAIKGLAKELMIPIIPLCQLNRSVETRGGDKRPLLSDLRESGAIEQDADMVSFLYRPEYYGIHEFAAGDPIPKGFMEFIIAKYREGNVDTVNLIFDMTIQRVRDAYDQDDKPDLAQYQDISNWEDPAG